MGLPETLLAISPGLLRGAAEFAGFLHGLECALEAGLPAVLLREPQLCARDLGALTSASVELCARYDGRWCGVHDSAHIALDSGADGVHLGFRSLSPAVVRDSFGDRLAIGFSTHAGDTAADWQGASYLTHGPLHATPSKQGLLEPVGSAALEAFVALAGLPVFGLGGLTPERAPECANCGAGVAVLSGILGDPDPGQATTRYLQALHVRP